MSNELTVSGFVLQSDPPIYSMSVPGKWLLEHTTPTWRIREPHRGFQRIVREKRAREIALAVLDQQRTFPNALVLATDMPELAIRDGSILLPGESMFLVVDGQHRLWAQKFSSFEAQYACLVHTGLSEVSMARLFIEINDNQKRVPSSLRWDLVRLVRPDDDPAGIAASEMIYLLATEPDSPLFQRVDLTGEQSEISLKQGSLAPAIKTLLSPKGALKHLSFEQQHAVVVQFFVAIREVDADDWGTQNSTFYRARILRALLRLLPELFQTINKPPESVNYSDYLPLLQRIDPDSLDSDEIRAAQGSAGIKAIYDQIKAQVIG